MFLSLFWSFLPESLSTDRAYLHRPATWASSKQSNHPQAVESTVLSRLRSYITSCITPSWSGFSVIVIASYSGEGVYVGQRTKA